MIKKKKALCILLGVYFFSLLSLTAAEPSNGSIYSLRYFAYNTLSNITTVTTCYLLYHYLDQYFYKNYDDGIDSITTVNQQEDFIKDAESFIKIYYPGTITTTLADVAGNYGAKADIQDIMSYLKNPQNFLRMGAKMPKGLLMNGAPGNGKTLMARAIAGQVNCPFLSLTGSSFSEMYVGVGARRVRILFKLAEILAEQYGACLVFIDEIDAVAQKRSGSAGVGDRDFNQTIAQLLQSMDGLEQHKNPIVVLAATNRMKELDPAIVRPGRFDRKIDVNAPEIKDRVALLYNALQSVPHDSCIDLHRFARICSGFSGAQLAQLINEAAIIAVQKNKSKIMSEDIELAYDYITLGREIVGMELDEHDRWITAVHEAGHAVGYLFGNTNCFAIYKASIVPRAHSLGVVWAVTLHESHTYIEEDMKARIVVALCGSLAEQEFGYGKSTGASSDLSTARSIAYSMVVRYGMSEKMSYISYDEVDHFLPNDIATQVHREVQKIIDECLQVAKTIIGNHKQDIENIASLLMKKGTVLGDEIYNIVNIPIPSLYVK